MDFEERFKMFELTDEMVDRLGMKAVFDANSNRQINIAIKTSFQSQHEDKASFLEAKHAELG